ncbi:hypothetical protein UlMin_040992 [Ulmus minor]
MESWNFASEGKTLLFSDEIDWSNAFGRTRKDVIYCEDGLVSSRESVESLDSMVMGFPEMLRKTFQSSQGVEILCGGEVGDGSSNRAASPACFISSNLSLGEEESGSKVSTSFIESNSHDSSLIDLKLGRLVDSKNSQNREDSKERLVLSSTRPSLLAKRARTRGSYSQTPFCQVYGCNMDLSNSKDYHKKHKVCDAHSKTSKVIVNGIEQRFCQQCSRFHLLAEFDDGKRSCRRRLAGHNERRRKPHLDGLSEKSHNFSHAYQDTRYLGTSLPERTPFVFSDILPGVILSTEKYDNGNQFEHIKFDCESIYSSQFGGPLTSRQLLSKSFTHSQGTGKQSAPGIPSSGTEDYGFHIPATTHKLSGASNSTRALSLLSAQSQNFSSHSAGIPPDSPLILQGAHHSNGQLSDISLRLRSKERYGPNGFYSCGKNSMGVDQLNSMMLPETSHTGNFDIHADGVFQDSSCLDTEYCLSPKNGSTVDLLQLSSHLQRVEHQRNYMQVKHENEEFCCFPTA